MPTKELFETSGNSTREAIQIIKYMGSKRGILDFVIPAIESITPVGVPVIDLFAGTHSVGYALANRHPVYANDIQSYSAPLGNALLHHENYLPSSTDVWEKMEARFSDNSGELKTMFAKWLKKEASHLCPARLTQDSLVQYAEFQDSFPFAGNFNLGTDRSLQKTVQTLAEEGKREKRKSTWSLMTTYFNNSYFALWQAIEIDSIRRAIEECLKGHSRDVALCCLMHACGYCCPAPGHFAQFRRLNNLSVYEDILKFRNRSPRKYFLAKFEEFSNSFEPAAYKCAVSTRDHANFILDFETPLEGATVYADPPYSSVHYSRFYHLLETLIRYDYPACDYYGRYREDRYQSPFCQGGNALNEFRKLIEGSRYKKLGLVISYANTALVPLDGIIEICKEQYGRRVRVLESAHVHCTQGRRGDKTRDVSETAIVCSC